MAQPQDLAELYALAGGYLPATPGIAPQRTFGFEGLPIPGGPPGQLAFAAVGQPFLAAQMHRLGMMPLGVGHDQNVLDTMAAMRFTELQNDAVRQAAQADSAAYMRSFRGLAAITGTPWGSRQRVLARRLSDNIAAASPFLVNTSPELLDQLAGPYGAASVLADRVASTGRYRIDPVTGQSGMSAASVQRMAQSVTEDLRNGGYRGLSAGQVGFLFEEAQARGMMPSAVSELGADGRLIEQKRAAAAAAAADPTSFAAAQARARVRAVSPDRMTSAELDAISLQPEIGERLRTFDADRTKRALAGYTKAITAVRDVFGDAGRPNAPIRELFAALEVMTAGASAQLDGEKLSRMVRQTNQLARMAGMPIGNALQLQQQTAAYTAQLGLEPVFAVQASQGAIAYTSAYRALGMGAAPAWGRGTADQLMQADAGFRARGLGSPLANQLGLLQRIEQTAGGFAAGSRAAALAAAVRAHASTFVDPTTGRETPVNMSDSDLVGILSSANTVRGVPVGLSAGDVYSMLGQTATNREFVFNSGVGNTIVRRAQAAELSQFAAAQVNWSLRPEFGESGEAAGRIQAKMLALPAATFSDRDSRTAAVAKIIGDELGTRGPLAGLDPIAREAKLRQLAERAYGDIDAGFATGQYAAIGVNSAQNFFALSNPVTLREAEVRAERATIESRMREATTSIPRGGMLARAIGALQDARPGDPAAALKIVAKAIGATDASEVTGAVAGSLRDLDGRRRALEAQAEKLRNASPTTKNDEQRRFDALLEEYRRASESTAAMGARYGLATVGLSGSELSGASQEIRDSMRIRDDAVGYIAGVGGRVSDRERAEVTGLQGKAVSEPLARASIIAKRKLDLDTVTADDIAKIRKSNPALASFTDAQLTAMLKQQRAAMVGRISPEELAAEMGSLNIDVAGDPSRKKAVADAVVLAARRAVPAAPSAEAIAQTAARLGISAGDAADYEASSLRIQRLGLNEEFAKELEGATWQDVNRRVGGRAGMRELADLYAKFKTAGGTEPGTAVGPDGRRVSMDAAQLARYNAAAAGELPGVAGGPGFWRTERDAMGRVLMRAREGRYTVSEDDRRAWLAANGASITGDMRAQMKARDPSLAGKTDAEVDRAIADRGVLTGRQTETRERFKSLWGSEAGRILQDQAAGGVDASQRVAESVLGDAAGANRFGALGVDIATGLQQRSNRLQELAVSHAGGNLARLLNGDYAFDWSTPEGIARAKAVAGEVDALMAGQLSGVETIRKLSAQPGTAFWGDGDDPRIASRAIAAKLAGTGAPAGRIDALAAKVFVNASLSLEEHDAARNRAGSRKQLEDSAKAHGFTSPADLRAAIKAGRVPAGMTAEQAAEFEAEFGRFDAANAKLGAAGARLGVPIPDDLEEIDRLTEEYRKKAYEVAMPSPTAVARDLLDAYGFAGTADDSPDAKSLQDLVRSPHGAAVARRAAASRRALAAAATVGGFGAMEDLLKEYDKAKTPEQQEALRRRIGASEDTWKSLQDDAVFQRSPAFAGAGGSLAALRDAVKNAQGGAAAAEPAGPPAPTRIIGDLTIHSDGRPASLDAVYALGESGHVVPGGLA